MRAVLQGARMALPFLTGPPGAEARDAVENLSAALDRGERRIRAMAGTYLALLELRKDAVVKVEGDDAPGDSARPSIPEPSVLAEQAIEHALRAVTRADWDHVAEAETYLRRLAPDLMFDLTVEVGQPPAPITFAGRWLVEPDPATTRREDDRHSYCGVAETRPGPVAVYHGYLDGCRPARLDRYDDLAAAADALPVRIVRRASTAVIREFNRQAWLRDFRQERERVRQEWLRESREDRDRVAEVAAARALGRPVIRLTDIRHRTT
jgi:hypothetical protein